MNVRQVLAVMLEKYPSTEARLLSGLSPGSPEATERASSSWTNYKIGYGGPVTSMLVSAASHLALGHEDEAAEALAEAVRRADDPCGYVAHALAGMRVSGIIA